MSILDDILAHKRTEVAEARRVRPAEALARAALERVGEGRDFVGALAGCEGACVVAEVKRRSPSRGEIRPDLDPVACALAYEAGGAAALSVLTDRRFFGGELASLDAIRARVALPLLRKDFVIDAYQIDEARAHGADAVLLIVSALSAKELAEYAAHARALELAALVEVHDEGQLELALEAGASLIGINNRDLRTFEVDLAVTERLAPRVPRGVIVVAESGIFTHDDLKRLGAAGAHAVLVGESLMREADVALALRRLRGRA